MIYRILFFAIFFAVSLLPVQAHTTGEPHDELTQGDNVIQLSNTKENLSGTTEPKLKSEYALPYPGILTDHPLYFFKKLRDSLLESLISDPVKKAEFYLLQSDKLLATAQTFHMAKNSDKSKDVAKQSLDMYKKAIEQGEKITQTVELPGYLQERFVLSAHKRFELFTSFQESESLPAQSSWNDLVSLAKDYSK